MNKYIYIPDTYNNNIVNTNFENLDLFVRVQALYRKGFEKILKRSIDFPKIDNFIDSKNINIPAVKDNSYNFYHKFSTLESKYLFVRNNFHVEKLSQDEIKALLSENISDDFYKNTINRVMYEDGDRIFFGTPIDENLVNSKSIVFEFAYDQKECTDLEQLNKIRKCIDEVFKYLGSNIKNILGVDVSFVVYKAIPDIYTIKKE